MKTRKILTLVVFLLFLFPAIHNFAQESPYNSGTVWSLSFVRTGTNVVDDYLKGIKNTWEATMKEAIKEGLIKSYKILLGEAANKEDYNIILMIEFENMAALDPDQVRDKKWEAIDNKIKDKMKEEYQKTIQNYETIREWFGAKLMREIYLK